MHKDEVQTIADAVASALDRRDKPVSMEHCERTTSMVQTALVGVREDSKRITTKLQAVHKDVICVRSDVTKHKAWHNGVKDGAEEVSGEYNKVESRRRAKLGMAAKWISIGIAVLSAVCGAVYFVTSRNPDVSEIVRMVVEVQENNRFTSHSEDGG